MTGSGRFVALAVTFGLHACGPSIRQVPDPDFVPRVGAATFAPGAGPVVAIDEGHFNFHTVDGRYRSFAELLRKDGFRVVSRAGRLDDGALDADVLVIANALAEANADKWELPTPSAFTEAEIDDLDQWIRDGGALLFIADHMPFPGSGALLAERLGLLFINGYAFHDPSLGALLAFERNDGLVDHAVTRGRSFRERVDKVVSFTGQVFRPRPGTAWEPVLVLPDKTRVLLPERAGRIDEKTPRFSAEGLWQGALRRHGKGRIAVFGEAAMFSAQRIETDEDSRPMGMNHPEASDNPQFLLNVVHWLAALL